MGRNNRGWVGVDLDGTLAYYDQWRGIDHIGDPIPLMVERVKLMLEQGIDVRIFTARVCDMHPQEEIDKFLRAITKWTMTHIGTQLPVTCTKDFSMVLLYDDRAVTVEHNTGKCVGDSGF